MRKKGYVILAGTLAFAALAGRAQGGNGPVPAGSPSASAEMAKSAAPVSAPHVAADYLIGPGDALEVNVWKEPSISGTIPVRPDGMISLALIGEITAAGSTPAHLGDEVAQRLRKYINDPAVTVTVMAVNSKRIFLLGEIAKPGEMSLTPGLTPLQAIASAGGLTQYANGKRIYILRSANGKEQKIPFNYKLAVKDGNLQGVTLAPGDTIVVP